MRPRWSGAKAKPTPGPRPSAAGKMKAKPRPSALSALQDGKGKGAGKIKVKTEWDNDDEQDVPHADRDAEEEEKADWGCEDDEADDNSGDPAENVPAGVVKEEMFEANEEMPANSNMEAETYDEAHDTNKEVMAGDTAGQEEAAREDVIEQEGVGPDNAGAETDDIPELSNSDDRLQPTRCLGVLKMHNPKRDFGFISPLLEIPSTVVVPKGENGLWFFGAPMLQSRGPSVGREVRFSICAGQDDRHRVQATDVVFADDEEEAELSRRAEALRSGVDHGLDEAEKEDRAGDSHPEAPEQSFGGGIKQELLESKETGVSEVTYKRSVRETILQQRERFQPRAVKGETWSSDAGRTTVKIEYQEAGSMRHARSPGFVHTESGRVVKTEQHEPAEATAWNGDPSMAASSADSSAPCKLEEATQDGPHAYPAIPSQQRMDPSATPAEHEADGLKRLRSLVEENPYYKCFPCKAALKSQCFAGATCPDAHTLEEVRSLPDTKLVRKIGKKIIRTGTGAFMPSGMHMPLGMMWGMPSMGMGMPPFGVPPMGSFPPYLESKRKKKKKKSKWSD